MSILNCIHNTFRDPNTKNINFFVEKILKYPDSTISEFKYFMVSRTEMMWNARMLVHMLTRVLHHKNVLDINQQFWEYVFSELEETFIRSGGISIDELLRENLTDDISEILDQIYLFNTLHIS